MTSIGPYGRESIQFGGKLRLVSFKRVCLANGMLRDRNYRTNGIHIMCLDCYQIF